MCLSDQGPTTKTSAWLRPCTTTPQLACNSRNGGDEVKFLIALTLVAAPISSTSDSLVRSESVLVRAVPAGDAIDVATIGRVHLLGISAPKVRGDARDDRLGLQARERLAGLTLRHWIRLEVPSGASWHQAYVWREDGVFVNALLVREGLAHAGTRGPGDRLEELRRAEREARTAKRGMWR